MSTKPNPPIEPEETALLLTSVAEGKTAKQPLPKNVIWIGISSFFNDISGEIAQRALPLYLVTLGVSFPMIGLIEGIADTTSSLLKIVSGWYSDKWGKRKVIAGVGYTLTFVARPILYFTSSWVLPLIGRFVDRAGKGIRTSPRDALVADSVDAANRGRAFGFHRALDPLGAVVGALLAAWVIWHMTGGGSAAQMTTSVFRTLILIAIIPTGLSVLIIFFLVKEKKIHLKSASKFRFSGVGIDSRFNKILGILVLFTLGASSDAFLLLRAQSLGISPTEIFIIIALLNLVTTLSAFPAGVLSDRIDRKWLIVFGWVFYAAIYAGFGFANSSLQIWILYIGYGLYYGLTEGVEKAMVADLVHPESRGTAYGLYNAAIGITVLPASVIAGYLWQEFGPHAPFLFGSALALLAALLMLTVRTPKPATATSHLFQNLPKV